VTRKNYDQRDNLTAVTYPDGSAVSMTYDLRINRPTQKVDENGGVTRNTYDAAGNLVQKVEAAGTDDERITDYTYDGDGNLLTVTVAGDDATEAARTVMTYDDAGNLTSVTDPAGGMTQFTSHDVMGNVLEKIDARGKTWSYTYDDLGRLLTVVDPAGGVTTHSYDAAGNRIKTVDAEGRKTELVYDARDNLILSRDHLGNETVFEYNTDNKLIRQTDAEGRIVAYAYDSEGRLTETVDGHEDWIAMEYDDAAGGGCASCGGAAGSLPSRVVYPTFEKQFGYDKKNRKITEADIAGGQTLTTAFEYAGAGNLIYRTDEPEMPIPPPLPVDLLETIRRLFPAAGLVPETDAQGVPQPAQDFH
jgi:YD repeat-containing protein